ncbi:hypothetical protein FXO38_36535 [Capsicum annuum]|nr:hypothetical protein FXO37_36607 [Capsicum annuum]KAF3612937.1 hypothetical protein FXO38_36535 [Capsicum annuum]
MIVKEMKILRKKKYREVNDQLDMFLELEKVVDKETSRTWKWFAKFLQSSLNLADGEGFTFMSDMQKVMVRLKELEEEGRNWKKKFNPYAMKLYTDYNMIAHYCEVKSNKDQEYGVVEGEDTHVAHLGRKTCIFKICSNPKTNGKKFVGASRSKNKSVGPELHVATSSTVADTDRDESEEDDQPSIQLKRISKSKTRLEAKKFLHQPTGTRKIEFKGDEKVLHGFFDVRSDQLNWFYNYWGKKMKVVKENVVNMTTILDESKNFFIGSVNNFQVKFLGEEGFNTELVEAAAICSPWDILIGDRFIKCRLAKRTYDISLGIGLKAYVELSFFKCAISLGISPDNLFISSDRVTRFFKIPIGGGMVPMIQLLEIITVVIIKATTVSAVIITVVTTIMTIAVIITIVVAATWTVACFSSKRCDGEVSEKEDDSYNGGCGGSFGGVGGGNDHSSVATGESSVATEDSYVGFYLWFYSVFNMNRIDGSSVATNELSVAIKDFCGIVGGCWWWCFGGGLGGGIGGGVSGLGGGISRIGGGVSGIGGGIDGIGNSGGGLGGIIGGLGGISGGGGGVGFPSVAIGKSIVEESYENDVKRDGEGYLEAGEDSKIFRLGHLKQFLLSKSRSRITQMRQGQPNVEALHDQPTTTDPGAAFGGVAGGVFNVGGSHVYDDVDASRDDEHYVDEILYLMRGRQLAYPDAYDAADRIMAANFYNNFKDRYDELITLASTLDESGFDSLVFGFQ